ncbi:MAG: helix-turn-helix domain-containing protein [Acidimicrobiales bacterium]|jgi:excisionase family DNA binding protein
MATTRSAAAAADGARLLNIAQAAGYLGLSVRHLRRLVQERRLSHYKVGGRLVFEPRDLDALLSKSRREAVQ